MKEATITPFAKPLYVMTKPVGAVCNLACDYCYYLEKAKLYEEQPRHVMSDELLEKFITAVDLLILREPAFEIEICFFFSPFINC